MGGVRSGYWWGPSGVDGTGRGCGVCLDMRGREGCGRERSRRAREDGVGPFGLVSCTGGRDVVGRRGRRDGKRTLSR